MIEIIGNVYDKQNYSKHTVEIKVKKGKMNLR